MGRFALCTVLALAPACAVPRPYGQGVTLHTVATAGYRFVDDETFDGHDAYGLELVTCELESGWGYELGGTYGFEDVSDPREPSAEFNEVYLGLRRTWPAEWGSARPYLGFGGAFTRVDLDLDSPEQEFEDEGGAAYAHGGVLWRVGPLPFEHRTEFLVGFDLRGLVGDDYDYAQLALVLGFGR
jgi:hypothetical protein